MILSMHEWYIADTVGSPSLEELPAWLDFLTLCFISQRSSVTEGWAFMSLSPSEYKNAKFLHIERRSCHWH